MERVAKINVKIGDIIECMGGRLDDLCKPLGFSSAEEEIIVHITCDVEKL